MMQPTTERNARANTPEAISLTNVCQQVFGDHPVDVVSAIGWGEESLGWLEEIFRTIANDALDGRKGYRIKHLAELGAYLALDFSNLSGTQREKYQDNLIASGVAVKSDFG